MILHPKMLYVGCLKSVQFPDVFENSWTSKTPKLEPEVCLVQDTLPVHINTNMDTNMKL